MAKVKVIKKLLKGIGSLFKERGEAVPQLFKTPTKDPELGTRVFFNNLLKEFGEKQVKESVEITRKAWKKKQFFPGGPQGDRFEDDLVNLLETRYMSSDRLQAHPLSFNRRGAGAADRYKMPKLGEEVNRNVRRTDLPGGPGDPAIYKNRWGEMSDNINPITKKKIYDKPPSILDEYSDDVIARIRGNQNVSPEDINKAYDIKMGQREMARGKKSIFDHPYVKEAEEKAGWGYKKKDDEGILKSLRKAADEELDKVRLQSKQMNAAANQVIMMTNRMEELAKKGDWEGAKKIRDAIEEYRLKVQANKGTIIDDFPILIDPTRKPNAKGGRVGLFRGGLSSLLRMINPALERKMVKTGPFQTGHRADAIADMEQIKNITRNEATDLERIYELEDMIQNSPRYNDKMKNALLNLIDYEKFRANQLYDNPKLQRHMKADPEGTEAYLRWLYRSEGSDSGFNIGGRVGYAEGNIVEPTGYVSPSEMKTAAGYLSPLAMAKSAGYQPTTLEAIEELLEEYELDDYLTAANGGRVGMFTGGIPLAHRGIGYLWRAIKEAAEQAGKISGRTGGKYKIGDVDYLFKRSPRSKFTKEEAIGTLTPRLGRKYGMFGRRIPRHIEEEQEKMIKLLREFGEDYADGGRVGMFAGGKLLGEGIMQAAKLAQKGIKPFGQKQTYKQNVTQKGVSNEQFDEIFKKQLNRVPDEVVDEPTGRGLNSSLLEAEAILTGQKFGLLTQAQRTKIAQAMRDKVAKQIYDDPNPRLSNDYFEYMDNAVDRMDDLLEIEKLGGDLTPKPIFDGTEIIGAQVDFTQLNRLGNKAKDNIIPFKPKTKKSKGGTIPPLKGPMSDGMGSLFRSK